MKSYKIALIILLLATFLIFISCGDDDDDDSASADDDDIADDDDNDDQIDDDDDDDSADDDDDDDQTDDDDDDLWEPSTCVPIQEHQPARGWEVIRGIIHLHSNYSHDACDGFGFINDELNMRCLEQLREAFCTTNQQYIMLSDHKDPFSDFEFPEVLLYLEEEGDTLVYAGNDPVANIIHCDDGNDVILWVGNENSLMPLGMVRMPDGDAAARRHYLGSDDATTAQSMKDDLEAIVIVNHAEGWTYDEIMAIPVDGIEVYNLHANIIPGMAAPGIVQLITDVFSFLFPLSESGHADLVMLTFLIENEIAAGHWDRLLDQRRTLGVLGTDAHRNSLPFPLMDGDRADSYRRMMRWFANYLLVDEVSADSVKSTIAQGRLYGAFQVFGEPMGFDFWAEDSLKGEYDMGDEVQLVPGLTLHVKCPEFWGMNYSLAPEPDFTLKIIKAGPTGGTVVAEAENGDIQYTVSEPGAYRATVTVVPHHLEPWLGTDWERFIREYPLIYANPIYVID